MTKFLDESGLTLYHNKLKENAILKDENGNYKANAPIDIQDTLYKKDCVVIGKEQQITDNQQLVAGQWYHYNGAISCYGYTDITDVGEGILICFDEIKNLNTYGTPKEELSDDGYVCGYLIDGCAGGFGVQKESGPSGFTGVCAFLATDNDGTNCNIYRNAAKAGDVSNISFDFKFKEIKKNGGVPTDIDGWLNNVIIPQINTLSNKIEIPNETGTFATREYVDAHSGEVEPTPNTLVERDGDGDIKAAETVYVDDTLYRKDCIMIGEEETFPDGDWTKLVPGQTYVFDGVLKSTSSYGGNPFNGRSYIKCSSITMITEPTEATKQNNFKQFDNDGAQVLFGAHTMNNYFGTRPAIITKEADDEFTDNGEGYTNDELTAKFSFVYDGFRIWGDETSDENAAKEYIRYIVKQIKKPATKLIYPTGKEDTIATLSDIQGGGGTTKQTVLDWKFVLDDPNDVDNNQVTVGPTANKVVKRDAQGDIKVGNKVYVGRTKYEDGVIETDPKTFNTIDEFLTFAQSNPETWFHFKGTFMNPELESQYEDEFYIKTKEVKNLTSTQNLVETNMSDMWVVRGDLGTEPSKMGAFGYDFLSGDNGFFIKDTLNWDFENMGAKGYKGSNLSIGVVEFDFKYLDNFKEVNPDTAATTIALMDMLAKDISAPGAKLTIPAKVDTIATLSDIQGGGGGAQADWNATSGASQILNKPADTTAPTANTLVKRDASGDIEAATKYSVGVTKYQDGKIMVGEPQTVSTVEDLVVGEKYHYDGPIPMHDTMGMWAFIDCDEITFTDPTTILDGRIPEMITSIMDGKAAFGYQSASNTVFVFPDKDDIYDGIKGVSSESYQHIDHVRFDFVYKGYFAMDESGNPEAYEELMWLNSLCEYITKQAAVLTLPMKVDTIATLSDIQGGASVSPISNSTIEGLFN